MEISIKEMMRLVDIHDSKGSGERAKYRSQQKISRVKMDWMRQRVAQHRCEVADKLTYADVKDVYLPDDLKPENYVNCTIEMALREHRAIISKQKEGIGYLTNQLEDNDRMWSRQHHEDGLIIDNLRNDLGAAIRTIELLGQSRE
jgi:hypothetical protein